MPKEKDSDILVVDLGFSNVKYMYGDIKGKFPSAYRLVGGGGYLYGNDAVKESNPSYLKTPEDLIRHYPGFVSICKKLVGVVDLKVSLAVGLPYEYWAMENRPGGAVHNLMNILSADENIKSVIVLPQGLGGIRDYIYSVKGKVSGNILAVDIGFNTVISTVYSVSSGEFLYENTYYKSGIHQMATVHVFPRVRHLVHGRTLKPLEISMFMEKSRIHGGAYDKFDISAEIAQAAEDYVKHVFEEIYSDLRVELGAGVEVDKLILFGGGAALLKESLPADSPFTINDEPEYANARGFALLGAEL